MPRCSSCWCIGGWMNCWVKKNRWKPRGWEEKNRKSNIVSARFKAENSEKHKLSLQWGGFPSQESSTFWWKREVCWLWNPIRKSVFGAKLGRCLLVCVRSLWTLFKVKTGHAWPSDLCVCVSTGPNQGWMATCTHARECVSVRGRCVPATEVT